MCSLHDFIYHPHGDHSPLKLLSLARDVALGMAYLHPTILHRWVPSAEQGCSKGPRQADPGRNQSSVAIPKGAPDFALLGLLRGAGGPAGRGGAALSLAP